MIAILAVAFQTIVQSDMIYEAVIAPGPAPTPPHVPADARQIVISIMIIITILIGMTCLFELSKDYLLDSASELMKPIVLQMFSEMTVLGFLSLVVFLLEESNALTTASDLVFGKSPDAEDEILELTEKTHYMIFLVMAVTIFQVVMLINIGNAAQSRYGEFNEMSQDEEEVKKLTKELIGMKEKTVIGASWEYLTNPVETYTFQCRREYLEEFMTFYSLRKEFLLQRSPQAPFEPAMETKRLPANFDYAHYQSDCMGGYLASLINLSALVWAVLWIFIVIFLGFMLIVNDNWTILAWTWVGVGYVMLFVLWRVHKKCKQILKFLINPLHFKADGFKVWVEQGEKAAWEESSDERDHLLKEAEANSEHSVDTYALSKAEEEVQFLSIQSLHYLISNPLIVCVCLCVCVF